jgi:hypothetical protein
MAGKFEIKESSGGKFRFNLKAGNGQNSESKRSPKVSVLPFLSTLSVYGKLNKSQ